MRSFSDRPSSGSCWWQQLLKLGAGQCIEGISENFCVWDADLIVLQAWPLLANETCFVAPLQDAYVSEPREAYESSTKHILRMEPSNPPKGGTWIAHHMVFSRKVLVDLLELIMSNVDGQSPWPLKLLKMATTFERMSEYVLYGTYASSSRACSERTLSRPMVPVASISAARRRQLARASTPVSP